MLGGSINIKHYSDAAFLDSTDVSVRPITKIVNLQNRKNALTQMQVISLNIPKSAKVYNRSLSSLLSTPDSLQQHSAVRASYEFNYLEERCRKCSRKVTFLVRNQSGSISTVTLTLRIVSIQFEPRSDFRSCCLIVRGRVVSKRTVVDNVYVKVTWRTLSSV